LSDRKIFASQIILYFKEQGWVETIFKSDTHPDTDGLVCFTLNREKQKFFIALTDPSVKGGTFSIANLHYFHEFLNLVEQDDDRSPFLFFLCTGGVRLISSRTIFSVVWQVLPRLFQLRRQRPYFSLAHEMCLGAGALFFGQAHFRLSSKKDTLINLTGPGIIQDFFGNSENFYQYASAEYQNERHFLTQEVLDNLQQALQRVHSLIDYHFAGYNQDARPTPFSGTRYTLSNHGISIHKTQRYQDFLKKVSDENTMLFSDTAGAGHTFLCIKNNKRFGLLINPLDHPANSITVKTVERYSEALKLFHALQIPLISVVDSPGGDPRKIQSDQDIISKTLETIELLTDYPYPKMGLIIGRCFGGSGLLALPKVHGSVGLYAVQDAKIGAVSDEIVDKLIKKNIHSQNEWSEVKKTHHKDLSDMLHSGDLNGIIEFENIGTHIDLFLKGLLSQTNNTESKNV